MKNGIALALTFITCGVGMLIGRALPRDLPPDAQAVARTAPSATVIPSRQPSCAGERAELATTKAQLATCTAFASPNPPLEPPADTAVETPDDVAARRAAQVRRNIDVLKTQQEVMIVRHSDHTVGIYPADQEIDDGLIVARRLRSGEIGWYDPDAGPRTDVSAFRPAPPGSPLELPKTERGPDGLLYINGELADSAVQRMFPPQ